jgi:hypothetical protein
MKNKALLLVAVALVAVVLGAIIISAALVLPRFPIDDVKCFDWTDVCHGAIVYMSLTTDALWMTNYSRKITFFFAAQNISGCPNATIFYNNSYVILNSVKLDPSYPNLGESPVKKLSEKQAWSVDWYFTPTANDFVLACMGISKGKHIRYPMFLEVNYTVVDSEGIEWLGLFQNSATVTIVGGDDAP